MKKLQNRSVTLVLGLIAAGTLGASAANILLNANLDTIAIGPQNGSTPVGWSVNAVKSVSGQHMDGCSSEGWCNVADLGGFGLFFKPFQGTVGDEITVHFYQDNAATAGAKYTLSGYAAGEANYSGLFTTNSPLPKTLFVVEFLDNASTVISSNGYDLVLAGMPTSGPGSMSLLTMPQVTAPVGTATVRAGVLMANAYSTTGGQSFFVDALELDLVPPPGSPVITNQPVATTVSPGGTAIFVVGVSNTAGLSYQWQKDGVDLPNGGNISGATTATLTIANATASDAARYRVVVANSSGTAISFAVPLALQSLHFYPVVELVGKIGDTYRVEYATALNPTTWISLSTNVLNASPTFITDTSSPGSNTRFYRSVFMY